MDRHHSRHLLSQTLHQGDPFPVVYTRRSVDIRLRIKRRLDFENETYSKTHAKNVFLLLVKKLRPPLPLFLTTAVFSDKDFWIGQDPLL